ncbi:hypothetical protein CAEBREN_21038 [Caenorhabditis brenneri]|uniref:Arrestin-like N-terminal domain-containing protein n=1 Tax=Caenorhabditis brenneri TaxID=135651 RepID=G0NW98_CAEBE|nr:hypothetical protein CAEBREN_21038 [Caenorhabditis brenneri]
MSLEIQFYNSSSTFTAGDSIGGIVTIKTEEPIEVTNFKVFMFIECRIVTSVTLNGKANTTDRVQEIMTAILDTELFDKRKDKTQILPPGTHVAQFKFSPFPTSYPHSFEGDKIMCRYFVRADLGTTSTETISTKKDFKVNVLPLEENPDAQGWQSASTTKILKALPLKKISMRVTIPKGIDRRQSVPIYISLSNNSSYPVTKVNSQLICTLRLPRDINNKNVNVVANESSENINVLNGNVIHRLKIHTGFSFDCPLIAEKFRIQVTVETSNGHTLNVEFPVLVGIQRNMSERSLDGIGGYNGFRPLTARPTMEAYWGPPPSYEEAVQDSRHQ